MIETALAILEKDDVFSASSYLCAQEDVIAAMQAFDGLIHKLYTDRRALDLVVILGLAGIQHGLTASRGPQVTLEARAYAREIAYHIGAFTWNGWNERDMPITATHRTIGMEAARLYLRLTREMRLDDIEFARAHVLVGAHYLSAGAYEQAVTAFAEAKDRAAQADDDGQAHLTEGMYVLANLLHTGDESLQQRLDEIQAALKDQPDGDRLAGQLATARRVFTAEAAEA